MLARWTLIEPAPCSTASGRGSKRGWPRSGTYGLSVESGEPIPDARLEARPTAERTVEEEERYRRG